MWLSGFTGGGLPFSVHPRHGFSENTLPLEQCDLSRSDQDVGSVAELLAFFHEALRRLPHCLRLESNFGGKHRAAVCVPACALGQVATTPRAEVRAASRRIDGKFRHPEPPVTVHAIGDGMPEAVDKEQSALFRG